MALWQWVLGLGTAAAVLSSRDAQALPTVEPDVKPPRGEAKAENGYAGVRYQARHLARVMGWSGATEEWFENFAQVQAFSESRGNFTAANRTSSERSAAKTAYTRNAPKMPTIIAGTTPDQWYGEIGSGGWYGLIMANGLYAFRSQGAAVGEVGPQDIFNAWRSTVMEAAVIDRLMGWSNFRDLSGSDRNAYALKRGMASPTLMDNVSGHARGDIANRHVDQAVKALGISESWKYETVPSELSRTPQEGWLEVMRAGERESV